MQLFAGYLPIVHIKVSVLMLMKHCLLYVFFFFIVAVPAALCRTVVPLNDQWRFILKDIPEGGLTGYDDSGWGMVSLPHCWGTEQENKTYFRGAGWYRRIFRLPASGKGKRCFVRFGAAGSMADVFVNGKRIGQHKGAFGAFCFEVTDYLQAGDNLLAVRVSNAAAPDIAPLHADFDFLGGLYRGAELVITDAVCISPEQHGAPGVALFTQVTAAEATVRVVTAVDVRGAAGGPVSLRLAVWDAKGKLVKQVVGVVKSVGGVLLDTQVMRLAYPHLWNGITDPYLYRLTATLLVGKRVVDAVKLPLGLRFVSIDPKLGLFLNGKHYAVRGVNRHQDREGKGWAVSAADEREDIRLIREMGATAVRGAHYQNSEYFYSLCDSVGLLAWAEIPLVEEADTSVLFRQTTEGQLKDLILQNLHHVSIFTWSLFNELNPKMDPTDLVRVLNDTAHALDATRPTIGAVNYKKFPRQSAVPDLMAWNVYPGWYGGVPSKYGKLLDDKWADGKWTPLAISEYGAGGSIHQHMDSIVKPDQAGPFHPEEWESVVHEYGWKAMAERPFVWGTFIWNMFDFAVASRNEGDHVGRNDKGMMTYDRKVKKDVFFFYQANWTTQPMVYITSRRFTERSKGSTWVKVYSNCETVQLFVNGVAYGVVQPDVVKIAAWTSVVLQPGVNKIRVVGKKGGEVLEDVCSWTLQPVL